MEGHLSPIGISEIQKLLKKKESLCKIKYNKLNAI